MPSRQSNTLNLSVSLLEVLRVTPRGLALIPLHSDTKYYVVCNYNQPQGSYSLCPACASTSQPASPALLAVTLPESHKKLARTPSPRVKPGRLSGSISGPNTGQHILVSIGEQLIRHASASVPNQPLSCANNLNNVRLIHK